MIIAEVASSKGPAFRPIVLGTLRATLIGVYPPLGATSWRAVRGGGCGTCPTPGVVVDVGIVFKIRGMRSREDEWEKEENNKYPDAYSQNFFNMLNQTLKYSVAGSTVQYPLIV